MDFGAAAAHHAPEMELPAGIRAVSSRGCENPWGRATRLSALCAALAVACTCGAAEPQPIHLGGRLELFTDDFLIERLEGARLRLHEPRQAEVALKFDSPWEGPFCGYITVIKDGDRYRMYYRGLPKSGRDGSDLEVTCYAESADGISWRKPDLGLFEVQGTRRNNVILHGSAPASHNFSPFLDTRPGVPPSERFKALAGTQESGLLAFVSEDGIRWKKMQEKPVFTKGVFDSQNVAFWSESEGTYACYFRTWTGGGYSGFRTVSRTISPDFRSWSEPAAMDFGGTPHEHLYTNQTHPYFRAPHIYVALPMRFFPGRQVLSDAQARALGVDPGYESDCADTVLLTSRGGNRYSRTFMEAFIRPGLDRGNWASRASLVALNVVPTGSAEMSLYKQANYAQPAAQLVRYVLRTDGFISVHGPFGGGEMLTRILDFTGKELVVNFSTSAAGGIRAEIQDASGAPLEGHSLADAVELVGDDIERAVSWKGGSGVGTVAGRPVRLRFVLKDADLYSIRFR